jgi:hypothetical protein
VTNYPTVATPVKTSHTHSQNAERLRALVEGVVWAASISCSPNLKQHDARIIPIGLLRRSKQCVTYFTREIRFISRNISFTSLSRGFLFRGPWSALRAAAPRITRRSEFFTTDDPVTLDRILLGEAGAHVLDKGVYERRPAARGGLLAIMPTDSRPGSRPPQAPRSRACR